MFDRVSKMKKTVVFLLVLCMLLANISFCKKVSALSKSYWLTGDYEESELIYNGKTLKVQGKWSKSALTQKPSYIGSKIKLNKKIKISPKCTIETGDDEMIKMSLKKYVKKNNIKKGDTLTSVCMEIKVVKGKVVKIGFYA